MNLWMKSMQEIMKPQYGSPPPTNKPKAPSPAEIELHSLKKKMNMNTQARGGNNRMNQQRGGMGNMNNNMGGNMNNMGGGMNNMRGGQQQMGMNSGGVSFNIL